MPFGQNFRQTLYEKAKQAGEDKSYRLQALSGPFHGDPPYSQEETRLFPKDVNTKGTEPTASVSVIAGIATGLRPRNDSAATSYKSSYRSLHSGFIRLIRSIFFLREPALICFSLEMAAYTSSVTS